MFILTCVMAMAERITIFYLQYTSPLTTKQLNLILFTTGREPVSFKGLENSFAKCKFQLLTSYSFLVSGTESLKPLRKVSSKQFVLQSRFWAQSAHGVMEERSLVEQKVHGSSPDHISILFLYVVPAQTLCITVCF